MGKYNSDNFREFLINEKSIPLKNIRFYQVWVDKFLSYYQKHLEAVKYNNIKAGLSLPPLDGISWGFYIPQPRGESR